MTAKRNKATLRVKYATKLIYFHSTT